MSLSLYATLGLTDNFTKPMRRVTEQMKMASKASRMMSGEYSKLTQAAKTYTGSTESFINKIGDLGKQEKKLVDGFVAGNDKMRGSFYKSIGSILARSTASEKIAQNFERMGNPIYKLSNPLLKVSQGIENITKKAQPAYLALKMLGPTANMKQLQDMTGLITKGMMRFQSVALASAIASAVLYGSLHKAAMKNKEYAASFNTMKETVRKAFEPMVEVFSMVMPKIYDFITAVAKMAIKFNEAHPTLAKIVQGFLMLLPAVTLLLSPLSVGIGLFGGLAAAWASLAPLVMPLVAGIAALSGPVVLVTAGIVALTAASIWVYKNWDLVKSKAVELWNKLGFLKGAVIAMLGPFAQIAIAAVKIYQNFDTIKSKAGTMVNSVISGVNKMIGVLNKIPGVNIPVVPKVNWGNITSAPEYGKSIGQGRQTSAAGGLSYVPRDGTLINAHRGERILTKQENKEYTNGGGSKAVSLTVQYMGGGPLNEREMNRFADFLVRKIEAAGNGGA
ncbi:hypothetical protein ACFWDG_06055 [Peribacillus sp. NPDC060186]